MKRCKTYNWVNLPCACCDSTSYNELGYRGGEAHRSGSGLRCKVVKCSQCGHVYAKPMPIVRDLNRLYADADKYFVHHDPTNKVKSYARLLQELEGVIRYKGKILDVGCGRGEMLSAATGLGWEAQGVEPSREFADLARLRYGVEVRNCSLEAAKYPDSQFDVVTLVSVIEHLYYPKQILLEINRVLKPRGLLWVDAPNEASLFNRIGNFYFKVQGKNWVTHLAPTFPPYHVQGFTLKSITTLLRNTGFAIERSEISSGAVLLPHRTLKEHFEYYGASAVRKLGDLIDMGSYMGIVARKVSSGAGPGVMVKEVREDLSRRRG